MKKTKLEFEEPKKKGDFILILIIIISIGLMGYAGWNLYSIFNEYHAASSEYDDIKQMAVNEKAPDQEDAPDITYEEMDEDGTHIWKAPIEVDFDTLKSINEDVVGWLYIEALPEISYPVVRGEDNDYYLHRTYKREDNFAGTLFIDCENSVDFTDCNTIMYGHNMKDGSMFGKLKYFKLQETYQKSPYLWVLTPDAVHKYMIFSSYVAQVGSDTYTLIKGPGQGLIDYAKKMKSYSVIDTGDYSFDVSDRILTLSTCTGDTSTRFIVQAVELK